MTGIQISGPELFLGGAVAFAVLATIVRSRSRSRRASAAAEIARVGTSVVSLAGRVLGTAAGIVGVQWVVITYAASNRALLWVALAVPALFAAYTLTKALTVTDVRPSPRRRSEPW